MKKIYFVIILLTFCSSAYGQLTQFRMIGSGTWATVNDSTFSSTVTIQADLTANGFLPTGIVDSMKVFTQTGQRYRIFSESNKTFSSADLVVVESGGNWGSPVGQVLIYENRGRSSVPSIPFSATGATAKMQEAADTYNSSLIVEAGNVTDGDKGEISVTSGVWTIDADAVTAAKIATGAVGADEIASTAVTPGSYTNLNATIDADGRITSASNGTGGSGGTGLSVLDTTFTINYTASTDSVINILTSVTESNDIVVTLPTPSASTVGISYTVNQIDRNGDGLGFTLVQVDGVDYDFYFSGDTVQFVSFTPDLDESYQFQTIFLDGSYRWLATLISSSKTFEVTNLAQIYNKSYKINDRIIYKIPSINIESVYFVKASNTTGYTPDSIAVIPTGLNFAILQPSSTGGYMPEWFGAIPDDGISDSTAFKKCVTWVTRSTIASKIEIGPGLFKDPQLIIAVNDDGGTYETVTMTVEGVAWPYANIPSIGKITAFSFDTAHAGIYIQSARSVKIKNIYMAGQSTAPFTNADSMIVFDNSDFARHHSSLGDAPHTGIVIDPFYSSHTERYPGLESYYTHTGGGSSMITIDQVSGSNLENFVSEVGEANGDNISITNANVDNVRRLYVTYCSQSRQGSVNNIYLKFAQTMFFNNGIGAPPSFSNINGAGFIREVFDVITQESKVTIDNSQFESIWRIGRSTGFPTSFVQTQFKFSTDVNLPKPGVWYDGANTGFVDCTLTYFDNNQTRVYLAMRGPISFTSCHFQSGIPYSINNGGTTNQITHNQSRFGTLVNATMNTGNSKGLYAGGNGTVLINDDTPFRISDSEVFNMAGGPGYASISFGSKTITQISRTKGYFFHTNAGRVLTPGDGLSTGNGLITTPIYAAEGSIGQVESVTGDSVVIKNLPWDMFFGVPITMSLLTPNKPLLGVYGDITAGNDTIKNVRGIVVNDWFANLYPFVRFNTVGFPVGTYMVSSAITTPGWIKMSAPATTTATKVQVKTTVDYTHTLNSASITSFTTGQTFSKGQTIYSTDPNSNWVSATVTTPGKWVTDPPVFEIQGRIHPGTTTGQVATWNASTNNYEATTIEYFNSYVDITSPISITFTAGSTDPDSILAINRTVVGFTYSNGVYTYTGTGGVFDFSLSASIEYTEASTSIFGDLYLNGARVAGCGFEQHIPAVSEVNHASGKCVISLATSDEVEVKLASNTHTGDDDVTVYKFGFTGVKIK